MSSRPDISICVCTFRRPALLARLLQSLASQPTEGEFSFSIIIVDNDRQQSAREIVMAAAIGSIVNIGYDVVPEQNIALARNRALENSGGDFVAFIDDDEIPGDRWLLTLYQALVRFGVDGVLGPVLPKFEQLPPAWVLKGRFFDRPSHPTGAVLDWKSTRTGNALLRKGLFRADASWFDPQFGSGGEDRDLFRRLIESGSVFVWCANAPVFETVAASRWKRTVLMRRALLRGKMAFTATEGRIASVSKSAAALVIYVVALPFTLFAGHHVFMDYLIRACDHLGKVLAFLGLDVVREKYVSG
jgi:succinoglycan biosynthesis protein ExoM